MPDIIGIGASVFDTLMLVESFPREDTKQQALKTMTQGGGPCATALAAAARLGVSAAYMGVLGDDGYGRYMMDDFQRLGVETSMIRMSPGCVSFHSFVILNTAASTRTVVWNKGTVPALAPDGVDADAIAKAKVLHLDGHQLEAAVRAARCAREAGVIVSLDAGGTYPGIETLLPLVDFLIPSEEFALKFTGERDPEAAARLLMSRYHPRALVVTQGSRGGFMLENGEIRRYPCYPVEVIDSCGAGDVFHGAFLAAWVRGFGDTMACCRFASAVSALKCTHFGARDGIPGHDEALAFLRAQGR